MDVALNVKRIAPGYYQVKHDGVKYEVIRFDDQHDGYGVSWGWQIEGCLPTADFRTTKWECLQNLAAALGLGK